VNHFDEIIARLESAWPAWHVWYVPKAAGGTIWCARRHDDHQYVVNEDTTEELELRLASEDREV
jgi:hypothetical protein